MPAEIYPGAIWRPGAAAGHAKGRNSVDAIVCHYTVGRDSSSIGLNGTFHWLVARDGHIDQYAETSALCWHAGEANGISAGIEIEFLDEPEGIFTDAARDATSGLIHWLHDEWGVPLTYYDGPRIPPHEMHQFVAHMSIQQTDGHSDYWPRADWDRMVTGPTPAPPEIVDIGADMVVIYQVEGMDPSQANRLWVGDVNIPNDVNAHLRLQALATQPGRGVVDMGTIAEWHHQPIVEQCEEARRA